MFGSYHPFCLSGAPDCRLLYSYLTLAVCVKWLEIVHISRKKHSKIYLAFVCTHKWNFMYIHRRMNIHRTKQTWPCLFLIIIHFYYNKPIHTHTFAAAAVTCMMSSPSLPYPTNHWKSHPQYCACTRNIMLNVILLLCLVQFSFFLFVSLPIKCLTISMSSCTNNT